MTAMPERAGAKLPSLAGAEFLVRPTTRRIMEVLNGPAIETRAVGGAVRDALMGRAVRDVDLATTAPPDKVAELAKAAGFRVAPTGIDHGTLTVIADGKPFEVTTLREDVETYGRRAKVAFGGDWTTDAMRRDFTINAFYASADGEVFDPLGGYADLLPPLIRFIGDPKDRIQEDYLRILRLFRFYAEIPGSAADSDGLLSCVRLRDGLSTLSVERVHAELVRLLAADGAIRAMDLMFDHGLLVALLAQAPKLGDLAHLCATENALGAPADPMLRLAALALYVEEDVGRLARRFNLSNAERRALRGAARSGNIDAAMDEREARRALYDLGPDAWRRAVLMTWTRAGAAPDDAAWRVLAGLPASWSAPAFPVTGHDLMQLGFAPGPQIGVTLRRLEQDWIDSDFSLERDALLQRAKSCQTGGDGQATRRESGASGTGSDDGA